MRLFNKKARLLDKNRANLETLLKSNDRIQLSTGEYETFHTR